MIVYICYTIWNQCQMKNPFEFPATVCLPADDWHIIYFIYFHSQDMVHEDLSRQDMANEERIFNYRLSGALRIMDTAFVILINIFGGLMTTQRQQPEIFKDSFT